MSAAANEEIVNKRGKVNSPVWQFLDIISLTVVRQCRLQIMQDRRPRPYDWKYHELDVPP